MLIVSCFSFANSVRASLPHLLKAVGNFFWLERLLNSHKSEAELTDDDMGNKFAITLPGQMRPVSDLSDGKPDLEYLCRKKKNENR